MVISLNSSFSHFTEAKEAEKKKANQTDSVDTYEDAFKRIKEINDTYLYSIYLKS